MFKYLSSLILVPALLFAAQAGAQTFAHYAGASGKPLASNGMQQVAEYHYYIYVTSTAGPNIYTTGGNTFVPLRLSFQNYMNGNTVGNGADLEPQGYIRWYNYLTDMRDDDHLVRYQSYMNQLVSVNNSAGKSAGYIGYNLGFRGTAQVNNTFLNTGSGPKLNTVGCAYQLTSDCNNADWAGADIGCDVSRYVDYNDNENYDHATFTHEPTLSIRYIFHVRSAYTLANALRDALLKENAENLTYEDHKITVFGMLNTSSFFTVRSDMSDATYYFFYPMSNADTKHVYAKDSKYKIAASDFTTNTLVHATKFIFRVYTADGTKYTDLAGNVSGKTNMFDVSLANINSTSNTWYDLDHNVVDKPADLKIGDNAYVVYYAADASGNKCPVGNVKVQFRSFYPKSDEQLINAPDRQTSYMEAHYNQSMAPISFDQQLTTQTLDQPTDDKLNMTSVPRDFTSVTYGFVYQNLISKSWGGIMGGNGDGSIWKNPQHSPQHGEYGFYKSAQYKTATEWTANSQVSRSVQVSNKAPQNEKTFSSQLRQAGKGYVWFTSPDVTLFDRTHHDDPTKYGSFLYVDASDESRQIDQEDFQASLCSGSQIVVSAWVASYTSTTNPEQPQVVFVLYGLKDGKAHRLLNIASGSFEGNIEGYSHANSQGTWYQVYGRAVLPSNSDVEQYSNFRIVIDNYCKSTNGADYAIDDIRIYQRSSKINVVQNKPLCPDETSESNVDQTITLKLKGNFESLKDYVGSNTSLFYRFYNVTDDQPVTGTDFYGSGLDNYGLASVPASYDATATLSDGTTPQFETENDGTVSLVLASKHFALSSDKQYYVQIALPSDAYATQPGSWGTAAQSCTAYSNNFQMTQENFVLNDVTGSMTTNVAVSCTANEVKDYSILGRVRTTNPEDGGSVTLSQVPFDWYIGTKDELNGVSGLVEAIDHFRQVYPTATDYNQTTGDVYRDADKKVLQQNVYNATSNPDGKLLLLASTTLTGYPLAVGTYTVSALPTVSELTINGYTYHLCEDAVLQFKVRVNKQGVQLNLGRSGVPYPSSSSIRNIRVGLPQFRTIQQDANASLRIPITLRVVDGQTSTTSNLMFVDGTNISKGDVNIIMSNTNDPALQAQSGSLVFATADQPNSMYNLDATDSTVNIRLAEGIIDKIHEGYWYELQLQYVVTNSTDATVVNCPGETFFRLKIVPEYVTWNPTAENGTNSNWNNDNNWRRSTAAELYDASYKDYGTTATYTGAATDNTVARRDGSYAPMYFTKVTVPSLTAGLYPSLGYVEYNMVGQAIRLTNVKNHVPYSVDGDETDMSHELEAYPAKDANSFYCQNYRGNICDQLYLKAGAELRSQQFLIYNKAWTELELPVGKWYSVASPLKDTYAGDYYVPAATGRQETQAFEDISWSSDDNNRVRYPFYQRAWGDATVMEQDGGTGYSVWDNPIAMVPADGTLTENANGWSHVYNNAAAVAGGDDQNANYAFSLRVGDAYMPTVASGLRDKNALVRLPKDDATYSYANVNKDGTVSQTTATLTRTNNGKLRVNADASETATGQITVTPAAVSPSDNHYYLIANPYTSSISVSQFLADNANALEDQHHLWVLRGDVLTQMPSENANQVSTEYNVIRPQESFFVKMTTTNQLVFNQGQQVDANIRSNTAKAALAKPMFVTYSYDNGSTTNISKVLSEDDGVLKTWCPSSGQLAIAYGGNDALTSLSVYTLDGRLWQILRPSAQTIYVQIPAGVYLVKGMTKKGNAKVNKQVVE
ncbi:MAG: hypothetical protein SPE56_11480 [Prevotella sp.]|nr:hypothetical protein [Prevotella sp.]